jgi:hypothetical protein
LAKVRLARAYYFPIGLDGVKNDNKNPKPCLVSCSVLQKEIERLIQTGELDVDVVFVNKYFHIDYSMLEEGLRQTLTETLSRFDAKPILVYGDLCLGPNGEMKKLAEEYGIVKVDAHNCVDCLLGGKGKINQADPNHEFMFMDPGMIEFFIEAKEKMLQEGLDEEAFNGMFGGIKGIVLLDTLGEVEKCKAEIEKLHTNLKILETKEVCLENLKLLLLEAFEKVAKI